MNRCHQHTEEQGQGPGLLPHLPLQDPDQKEGPWSPGQMLHAPRTVMPSLHLLVSSFIQRPLLMGCPQGLSMRRALVSPADTGNSRVSQQTNRTANRLRHFLRTLARAPPRWSLPDRPRPVSGLPAPPTPPSSPSTPCIHHPSCVRVSTIPESP